MGALALSSTKWTMIPFWWTTLVWQMRPKTKTISLGVTELMFSIIHFRAGIPCSKAIWTLAQVSKLKQTESIIWRWIIIWGILSLPISRNAMMEWRLWIWDLLRPRSIWIKRGDSGSRQPIRWRGCLISQWTQREIHVCLETWGYPLIARARKQFSQQSDL